MDDPLINPLSDVPKVPRKTRRAVEPLREVTPSETERALLERQQEHRRQRAKERLAGTGLPPGLEDQFKAEKAVLDHLARGRAQTRREIRRETDPARFGTDRASVRFPRLECAACRMVRLLVCGVLVLFSPFLIYFTAILVMV